MLTNNLAASHSTEVNARNTLQPRDEKQCDSLLAAAYAREVRLSQPQQLTQPPHENPTESSNGSGNRPIHQRGSRLYPTLGDCIPKHKGETPLPYSQEEDTHEKTYKHKELEKFTQKKVYNQPHKIKYDLSSIIEILVNSNSPKEDIGVVLSSGIAIDSFHIHLTTLNQSENLGTLSSQPHYFKMKTTDRFNQLLEVVRAYDNLFHSANHVVDSYNSLNLEQKLYDQVARKCLFLSEQMGQSALIIANHFIDLQSTIGYVINNPETPDYCLPTLMRPFISCSIMHLEYAIECRLRDLDAINNIAVQKIGAKRIPRKFSSIKHAPKPELKKPRLDQPQLNHAFFNFCRSLATAELFIRSCGKSQRDLLDQGRKCLFGLIDRYTRETGVPIKELLIIPDTNIIEKYLCYAELLHAADAVPEKHIETRVVVLTEITRLAGLNNAGLNKGASTETMIDKNDSASRGRPQLLPQFREESQIWRRFPLSDHIMLGVKTACTALDEMIKFEALGKPRSLKAIQVEDLLEELHNLDLWVNHLCSLSLISDEDLNTCSSYQQLIPAREALNSVVATYKSDLEATFEEAAKHITRGPIRETATQDAVPSLIAELSSPRKPILFTNGDLHKTINHYLFANNELTINEWNQQQGEQLIQRLTMRKQQLPCTQQLLMVIECCQHDERINQFINECRLIFIQMHPYVTSVGKEYPQHVTKDKVKKFQAQVDNFTTLNKKIQKQLHECNKKLNKMKPKTDEQHESLKHDLFSAMQTSLLVNTEHQHHLNIGLNLILEKRRQILTDDFPYLHVLEKHVYEVSTKKIKHYIKSSKTTGDSACIPSEPLPDSNHLSPPGKSSFFSTTPLHELGCVLDNSPPLNNLKIPCLESAREGKLAGRQFLDHISQQLRIQLTAYRTASDDFYSPTPGEPITIKNRSGQISFSHFLTGIRIRLDDPSTIKQRNYFHQCVASKVNALTDHKIPVAYVGSRAFQTQLQSLWGTQALERLGDLPLPKVDPAITRRATTPRDTDLLVLDKAQLTTVRQQMRKALLSAAQQNSDLKTDFEITTTDERAEIFYGTTCLSCNLILHKKGCRQPKHWIYVVDLVTCVDSTASALHTLGSLQQPSGETTTCRRIDAIIMDELNLVISMAAGPARALMAMIRISILAALEIANTKLDNMARMALIYALDTIHQHFPDPTFDQLAADLRSQTFTVVDHQGQILGVKPPVAP